MGKDKENDNECQGIQQKENHKAGIEQNYLNAKSPKSGGVLQWEIMWYHNIDNMEFDNNDGEMHVDEGERERQDGEIGKQEEQEENT